LGIIFLNDDPREVFRTEYALWTPEDANVEANLYRLRMAAAIVLKCKRLGGRKKHSEGEPWPGNYKYVDGPNRGQPVSPAVKVAPIWSEEIAALREISISYWRSVRCSAQSADFTPVAIDQFAIFPTV